MSDVLDHMIHVFRHSKLQRWLTHDYTHILLNHILPYPHHIVDISSSHWTGNTISSLNVNTMLQIFRISFVISTHHLPIMLIDPL